MNSSYRYFPVEGIPNPTLIQFSTDEPAHYKVRVNGVVYNNPGETGYERIVSTVEVTIIGETVGLEALDSRGDVVAEGVGQTVAMAWRNLLANGPANIEVLK